LTLRKQLFFTESKIIFGFVYPRDSVSDMLADSLSDL